jgi:hypothetical protein
LTSLYGGPKVSVWETYRGDVAWMVTERAPENVKHGDTIDIEITGIGTLRAIAGERARRCGELQPFAGRELADAAVVQHAGGQAEPEPPFAVFLRLLASSHKHNPSRIAGRDSQTGVSIAPSLGGNHI